MAQRFLEDYVSPRKKPSTLRLYRLAHRRPHRPAARRGADRRRDREDAVKLHDRLRATPILANRVLAVLSKLLAWSMTKRSTGRPARIPATASRSTRSADASGTSTRREYTRLGRALRTATIAPGPRTAIELLLLTGARPDEIATLQWAHVDLAGAALHLPDSKTGAKTIHLSPPALKLLKRWPRFAASPYVFPGHRPPHAKGAHLHASTLAHVWADLRTAAQLDDVRLYDACRHSLRVGRGLAAWAEPRADRRAARALAAGDDAAVRPPARRRGEAERHGDRRHDCRGAASTAMTADAFARVTRWLPYALLPADDQAPPQLLELRLPPGATDWGTAFQAQTVDTVQVWPIDIVLKNLAIQAMSWQLRRTEHGGRLHRCTRADLRAWIDSTHALCATGSRSEARYPRSYTTLRPS